MTGVDDSKVFKKVNSQDLGKGESGRGVGRSPGCRLRSWRVDPERMPFSEKWNSARVPLAGRTLSFVLVS